MPAKSTTNHRFIICGLKINKLGEVAAADEWLVGLEILLLGPRPISSSFQSPRAWVRNYFDGSLEDDMQPKEEERISWKFAAASPVYNLCWGPRGQVQGCKLPREYVLAIEGLKATAAGKTQN